MAKTRNQVATRAAKKAGVGNVAKKSTAAKKTVAKKAAAKKAPAKEPAVRKTRAKKAPVVKRPKNYKGYKVIKKTAGALLPHQTLGLPAGALRQPIGMFASCHVKELRVLAKLTYNRQD